MLINITIWKYDYAGKLVQNKLAGSVKLNVQKQTKQILPEEVIQAVRTMKKH